MRKIVVGVDGSDGSLRALDYALQEADRPGDIVNVVSAFESFGRFGARYGLPLPVHDEQLAAAVEAATRESVDGAVAKLATHPTVRVIARAGSAEHVLTEAATDADLLVIGHRGLGRIGSALLGSVGLACVLHAPCTVVVVAPKTQVVAADDKRREAVLTEPARAALATY